MEIFGVGPLEFILILVLALVILGPEDMVGTARKIGQWVYRVVRSPTWRAILETSQDLRELPQKIVRDAGLEETMKEIKQTADDVKTDLSQTTSQINAEMQAATSEVNREMQTVAQDANAGLKEASAETQAAMQSAAQDMNAGLKEAGAETQAADQSTAEGLPDVENTIAPPSAQLEFAALDESALVESAALEESAPVLEEVQLTPYEAYLAAIAAGLGRKGMERTEPEENTIFRVRPPANAAPTPPPAEISKKQTYVAGLETFAQALGVPATAAPRGAEKSSLENQEPVETEPAPAHRPAGTPVDLNLNSSGTMEERLKKRMDEMAKSIEKLDAKIASSSGEEEKTALPQTDGSAPLSEQDASHGNGSEPPAAPARVRRSAKRPLEAKSVPQAEAEGGEHRPAVPRKRAAKTSAPDAEAAAGEAPASVPRKRAAKKTPVPKIIEPDSTSSQA